MWIVLTVGGSHRLFCLWLPNVFMKWKITDRIKAHNFTNNCSGMPFNVLFWCNVHLFKKNKKKQVKLLRIVDASCILIMIFSNLNMLKRWSKLIEAFCCGWLIFNDAFETTKVKEDEEHKWKYVEKARTDIVCQCRWI